MKQILIKSSKRAVTMLLSALMVVSMTTGMSFAAENGKSSDAGAEAPVLNKQDHYAYIIGYPDGTIRPEKEITRAEVATIFFRMLTQESRMKYWKTTNDYTDVNSTDWYHNAVSVMSNAGIVRGYEGGTFKPDQGITRAEFAVIASRFERSKTSDFTLSYSDINDIEGHWAESDILSAEILGYIKGYEDNSFKPDRQITRAEGMVIVNRVLERMSNNQCMEGLLSSDMNQWSDNMDTSAWYYTAIQEATNSHAYKDKSFVKIGQTTVIKETWTKMLEAPDWAALEKEWSDTNSLNPDSSKNPGEVAG